MKESHMKGGFKTKKMDFVSINFIKTVCYGSRSTKASYANKGPFAIFGMDGECLLQSQL